ncbi:MAG: hypothetical protein EOP50_05130 [Sphingobacteriales bacterium]|nr:MAG: hypothetical protein EOP50_05130 [Sphingobacteriales bacterium]
MNGETSIFDEDQSTGKLVIEANEYWETRRLSFNLWVGSAGLIVLYLLGEYSWLGLAGAFAWGVLANVLYSVGYVLESYLLVQRKANNRMAQWRSLLFGGGTALYVLATLAYGIIFGLIRSI